MTDMPDEIHPDSPRLIAEANGVALRLLAALNALEAVDVRDVIAEVSASGRGSEVLMAVTLIADRLLDALDHVGALQDGKSKWITAAALGQLDALAADNGDTPTT